MSSGSLGLTLQFTPKLPTTSLIRKTFSNGLEVDRLATLLPEPDPDPEPEPDPEVDPSLPLLPFGAPVLLPSVECPNVCSQQWISRGAQS